jgi:hypothetical protein
MTSLRNREEAAIRYFFSFILKSSSLVFWRSIFHWASHLRPILCQNVSRTTWPLWPYRLCKIWRIIAYLPCILLCYRIWVQYPVSSPRASDTRWSYLW